jgi:hypothetical protein
MTCSPYDLRDYLFEELTPAERGEVRLHLKTCAPCSSELQSLRLTHSALLALRDEEMPQRIGFVSDKVFEPSPVRRWFNGFWTSAARIGFVSSAMLSAAILVHAVRFVPDVHNNAQSAQIAVAQITQAEIDRRIDAAVQTAVEVNAAKLQSQFAAAVTQAVAENEKSAQKRTSAILAAAERHSDQERQALRAEYAEYMRSRRNVALVAQNYGGGSQ